MRKKTNAITDVLRPRFTVTIIRRKWIIFSRLANSRVRRPSGLKCHYIRGVLALQVYYITGVWFVSTRRDVCVRESAAWRVTWLKPIYRRRNLISDAYAPAKKTGGVYEAAWGRTDGGGRVIVRKVLAPRTLKRKPVTWRQAYSYVGFFFFTAVSFLISFRRTAAANCRSLNRGGTTDARHYRL